MLLVSVGFQPYTRQGRHCVCMPLHKTFHIALFVFLFLSLVACPSLAALYDVQAASNTVSQYTTLSEKDTKNKPCTRLSDAVAWGSHTAFFHMPGACEPCMKLASDQSVIHASIITTRLLL
jgi:hypothetical protein